MKKLFSKPQKLHVDYRPFVKSFSLTTLVPSIKVQSLSACTFIQSLDLSTSPCLGADDLWILVKKLANLTTLKILCSSSIGEEGFKTLSKASNLAHLYLYAFDTQAIMERGLEHIATAATGLISFGLEYRQRTRQDTRQGFEFTSMPSQDSLASLLCILIDNHKGLKNLSLDWPLNVNQIMDHLISKKTQLESLKLCNAKPTQISKFFQVCPGLKSLIFTEVYLTDPIDTVFVPLTSNHSHLISLTLNGVCTFTNLIPLIPCFTNLKTLVFSPSTRSASVLPTASASLLDIANSCPFLEIISIPIYDNTNLLAFANGCPRLEQVDLQDGRGVDDVGILGLVSKCNRISKLSLGFASLSDDCAIQLGHYLKDSLVELHLPTNSRPLSPETVILLLKQLVYLEKLANVAGDVLSISSLSTSLSETRYLQELEFGGFVDPVVKEELRKKVKFVTFV